MKSHLNSPKFKVVGKAEYWVGQLVQRRDADQQWGQGYITSVKPVLVTVLETPEARGYQWDEVLPIPDVDGEDGLQTPNYKRKETVPTPAKATSRRSRLVSQRVARVRKDASIAYLLSGSGKVC